MKGKDQMAILVGTSPHAECVFHHGGNKVKAVSTLKHEFVTHPDKPLCQEHVDAVRRARVAEYWDVVRGRSAR